MQKSLEVQRCNWLRRIWNNSFPATSKYCDDYGKKSGNQNREVKYDKTSISTDGYIEENSPNDNFQILQNAYLKGRKERSRWMGESDESNLDDDPIWMEMKEEP